MGPLEVESPLSTFFIWWLTLGLSCMHGFLGDLKMSGTQRLPWDQLQAIGEKDEPGLHF